MEGRRGDEEDLSCAFLKVSGGDDLTFRAFHGRLHRIPVTHDDIVCQPLVDRAGKPYLKPIPQGGERLPLVGDLP